MSGTTESKLEYLIRSKEDVRLAIERKLIPCPEDTPFLEYGPKIKQVQDPLDTSDATATAADIRKGTSAYGATGTRLDGTLVPLDTSDATAKASDIRKGETAYSTEGTKLTGTLDPIDTSDATATAADIREGTTAYGADGTKLTGTLVPLDLSDATATAANLDKGVIAYTKDNQRIIGTTKLLNAEAEPVTLPFATRSGTSGKVYSLSEYIPLINDSNSGGACGATILFPVSKLPVDITGRNIVLRVAPSNYYYESYNFRAELLIAPSMDNWFDVRRDSSRDLIRCWTADQNTRVNFQYYSIAIAGNGHTIDEITPDSWTDQGLVSVTGQYYTNNSWYRFSTKTMISKGGLGAGTPYMGRGDDCFIQTVLASPVVNYKMNAGGIVLSRIPNAEVAKAIQLKAQNIVTGKTYLGVQGTANIDSFMEYDDCVALTTEILTGVVSDPPYEFLEYLEGTGTQYINTGITPNQGTTSAEIDFQMTQTRSGEQWAFGQWAGYVAGVSNGNGWRCGGANGTLDTNRGFTYSSTVFTDRMIGTSTASPITATYPMTLFCQQEEGTPGYLANGYVRIYSCKIWEAGELVRDFVPAMHKISGEIGMYDKVTRSLFKNAGTGTFIAGPSLYSYTQLEYIESTGTQYFKTGYYPHGQSGYELQYSNYTGSGVLFGAYNSNWADGSGLYSNTTGAYNYWMHYLGNLETNISCQNKAAATVAMNRGVLNIDGVSRTVASAKEFEVNYPLYILAGNMKGVVEQPVALRLHKFIIKPAGQLTYIHEFIPAIQNETGILGLYDKITKTFLTNAGTGNFIAGPVVGEV